ncbi:GNAT family N-acetyltransferase [Pontiellaceae bacterium B1224]|nr:GNAT family N-acetyltransferase [Pontiellaceae bacterium B1224]
MNILNLKDEPQHLPILASWHHAEWLHLNPEGSLEDRIEKMGLYLSDDPIPSTFIYVDQNRLIGSAAVIEHDMDTHKELSPWLASVYVHPECRNRGIGSKLVRHVMQYIHQIGFSELYLFTEDQVSFYSSLGWVSVSEETYRKADVTVMKTTIRATNPH